MLVKTTALSLILALSLFMDPSYAAYDDRLPPHHTRRTLTASEYQDLQTILGSSLNSHTRKAALWVFLHEHRISPLTRQSIHNAFVTHSDPQDALQALGLWPEAAAAPATPLHAAAAPATPLHAAAAPETPGSRLLLNGALLGAQRVHLRTTPERQRPIPQETELEAALKRMFARARPPSAAESEATEGWSSSGEDEE